MVVALQLSAPFIGILFLCINTIQGMGKALPSLVLTVCRQGLIFIPLIFILNAMLGLDGVIYAQPAADYLSILVGIMICMHLFRSMEHRNVKIKQEILKKDWPLRLAFFHFIERQKQKRYDLDSEIPSLHDSAAQWSGPKRFRCRSFMLA